jgi:hypothetical protein
VESRVLGDLCCLYTLFLSISCGFDGIVKPEVVNISDQDRGTNTHNSEQIGVESCYGSYDSPSYLALGGGCPQSWCATNSDNDKFL